MQLYLCAVLLRAATATLGLMDTAVKHVRSRDCHVAVKKLCREFPPTQSCVPQGRHYIHFTFIEL